MEDNSFLGRGWSFPPTFNKSRAEIEMVSKEEDIKQSLEIYFYTKLGERIMRQDYGCVIHEHLFDSVRRYRSRSCAQTAVNKLINDDFHFCHFLLNLIVFL